MKHEGRFILPSFSIALVFYTHYIYQRYIIRSGTDRILYKKIIVKKFIKLLDKLLNVCYNNGTNKQEGIEMMYAIYEDFYPDVEKKLNHIAKKCMRHGNDFVFEVKG